MTPDFSGAPCIGRPELFQSTHAADHHEARELCATCPALEACKVLLSNELVATKGTRAAGGGPCGTWAGKLIGGARAACGTDSGYFRHRRLSETPCDGCRAAHAVADKVRRTRGARAGKPQVNAANRTSVRVESEAKRGPVRVNGTDPLTADSILETNGG